ncbi:hypothetical protein OE88DRAFT_1659688 [Heliocybe sulcata]|uniref:Uncharacterized protein n=1 Tax=Heliocybe sulcata TaxID=5364 RepID=A0A5C3N2C6_9AGAM|nr:hypothetical protein OE88DRAFT_1659688 [Heliocybe sulcata]
MSFRLVMVVWSIGALLFSLVFTLIKLSLGVLFIGAVVFGCWMWIESHRTGGADGHQPAEPTGTASTSREVEPTVLFNVEPKDLEEGVSVPPGPSVGEVV